MAKLVDGYDHAFYRPKIRKTFIIIENDNFSWYLKNFRSILDFIQIAYYDNDLFLKKMLIGLLSS